MKNKLTDRAKIQRQSKKHFIMVEGGKAFREGKLHYDNPYPPPTEKNKLWYAGWHMAKAGSISTCTGPHTPYDPELDVMPKIPERKPRKSKKDLEAGVLKECKKLLKTLGIFAWRNNTGKFAMGVGYISFGTPGSSDIIGICPDGRFLAIEAKRRFGGKQSKDQVWFQKRIEENNGVYLLVHSADELKNKLMEKGILG